MSDSRSDTPIENAAVRAAVSSHPRLWEANRYVYPVLSRRSTGISIGVNLNPDKICNFDCIYCQVDRSVPPQYRDVDLEVLQEELSQLLSWVEDGTLFERPPFTSVPDAVKRVNDIAFSGDGEPTSYPGFGQVVRIAAETRDRFSLGSVKLVVITNGTLFHRPAVKEALKYLDDHNGEIWAKLDAGTEAYYDTVERTKVPFNRIVKNITAAARVRPIVIQSLFMNINGTPPLDAEIAAYCGILSEILSSGGSLKLIQLYTVARQPAESSVTPLNDAKMDSLRAEVEERVGAPVEVFYGVSA